MTRLRGRGGVAGMAVAGALTAALLPLAHHGADVDRPTARPFAAGSSERTVPARPAAAGTCKDPEASLRPSGEAGPAVRRIQRRGYLVAGVDQNSFRWGYRDPATGDLVGFDIDLVRAIAKDILGDENKVRFRAIPTNQRVPALQHGKVDIVVRTMSITCDRIDKVAFSTAYFEAGQQVLAPRGSTIRWDSETLRGKAVCTADGSTGEAELGKSRYGAKIVLVPNQLDCLVRLQLGQVDAVVTDNALAAGQAAQDPSVELVGKPFTREPYGVAMNLHDTDLVRRVNKVLENYREGGGGSLWMQAYRKWLEADLKGITGPPTPKYRS